MKKLWLLLGLVFSLPLCADEITFTFLNFSTSTFSASASGLSFGDAINVLVTDNTNGHSMTLAAVDSGSTGTAVSFTPGPPLVAVYNANGPNSVLIESGGHVFLSGMMDVENELEAEYPNRGGAFLSRFSVNFVDPAILAALGVAGASFAPDGSVSLTLGETAFDGTTLNAVLGGGAVTIETQAPVPETGTILLLLSGVIIVLAFVVVRNLSLYGLA